MNIYSLIKDNHKEHYFLNRTQCHLFNESPQSFSRQNVASCCLIPQKKTKESAPEVIKQLDFRYLEWRRELKFLLKEVHYNINKMYPKWAGNKNSVARLAVAELFWRKNNDEARPCRGLRWLINCRTFFAKNIFPGIQLWSLRDRKLHLLELPIRTRESFLQFNK